MTEAQDDIVTVEIKVERTEVYVTQVNMPRSEFMSRLKEVKEAAWGDEEAMAEKYMSKYIDPEKDWFDSSDTDLVTFDIVEDDQ